MKPAYWSVSSVGSYFRLSSVVFQNRPADLAAVKAYAYADTDDGGLVLIHQATYPYLPQDIRHGRIHRAASGSRTGYGRRNAHCEWKLDRKPDKLMLHRGGQKVVACSRQPVRALFHEPVQLVFAGDITLDDGPGGWWLPVAIPRAFCRTARRDFRHRQSGDADATTGKALENKIVTFRAEPGVVLVLKSISCITVANNHSGDYGKTAFWKRCSTLGALASAGYFAEAALAEAHAPLWVEAKGLRIAVLGYNEFAAFL